MTWCLTKSGKRFDMQDPKPEQIDIIDITYALSKLCRFNGHTSSFYSVAQHSVHVCHLVPNEHKLAALLHDATEAYIGDMVSPLKAMIPQFREIEHHLWCLIADKFGVDRELHPDIKRADLIALATEKRDLMPFHPEPWPMLEGVEPDPEIIIPVDHEPAAFLFMDQFLALRKRGG